MKTQPPPPEPDTWKRFVETARHIMSVPKAEIDRREAAYKRQRARLKKKPGKKSAVLAGVVAAVLLLTGCFQYVPMRAPVIQPPATDSGKACWQACSDTAQTCATACGPNLAELVRKCKEDCATQRDRCQLVCK